MKGRKKHPIDATGARRQAGCRPVALPEPPAWMTPGAASRFRAVVEQLDRLGALAETDVGAVERYATTYDRWTQAEAALAESGDRVHYVRLLNRAGQPASSVPSPAMAQATAMGAQLARLEASLGLYPTERTRLPSAAPAADDDPCEALFRVAGGAA